MFALKPLHHNAIQSALQKAERYRFLNEPGEAESICLDILDVDPNNQQARVSLLLALTDQFAEDGHAYDRARTALSQVSGDYERAYYGGMVAERRAKAQASRRTGASVGVYEWIVDAMESILKGMDRWDSFVDLIAQLGEVIKLQTDARTDAQEAADTRREVPRAK